ncbi:UNVERIFIED_CONTAM: hypothetical protein Sindi_2308800, partial [Sesamum indicum]
RGRGWDCGRARGRGSPSPSRDEPTDASPAAPSSKESSSPRRYTTDFPAVGSNAAAGANSTQAPARPWDAPPPQPSLMPLLPLVVGDVSSAFGMRSLTVIFTQPLIMQSKGIICIPGPTSQIPYEQQLFWFQKLKMPYWWDYDNESMFKLIKSQAEKFLLKRFADARN